MPVAIPFAVEGGELLLAGAEGAEVLGVGAETAAGAGEVAAVGGGTAAAGATAGEALSAEQLAERLAKVLAIAKTLAAAKSSTCQNCCRRTVIISRHGTPVSAEKSADHIDEAQAKGFPSVLTYDPDGASARRAASIKNIPTKSGYDRDEYPPAVFAENAGAADVRYVPLGDNRSAGGQLRAQLAGATPGCIVTLKTGP